MATAYEVSGISADATHEELGAADTAKRTVHDLTADLGEGSVRRAAQRHAELAAAGASLRPALAAPPRLGPATERQRDRETAWALIVFVMIALLVPLLRGVAVPQRTVVATGADVAAVTTERAPDFQLEALDGSRVSLSDFKGRVVLINVWATWCPPCVREIPRLVRISTQYRGQGLVVLGVNTTYQDDRAKVATFVQEQGISYPVLLDSNNAIGQAYGARLLPTSYLIDHDGTIVHLRIGEVDEVQLREQVLALLKRDTPSRE